MQARILMGLTALYCGIFAGLVPAQPGAQEPGVQTQAAGSARAQLTLKLKDRLLRARFDDRAE